MSGRVVLAVYRPKPGGEEPLRSCLARHVPELRRLGLATSRPVLLVRAGDGTLIEAFEWVDQDAASRAHQVAEVAAIWSEMAEHADFTTLGSLAEASGTFPHFDPVDGVTA